MELLIDEYFLKVALPIITNENYKSMKNYVAHGCYSVYDHSIRVAVHAYSYARKRKLNLDYKSLIMCCLRHDFYLYDWHHAHEGHRFHGFRHPFTALMKAKKIYKLNAKVCNMIQSHMFPLVFWVLPLSKEAWILTLSDKKCAYLEHKTIKAMKKIEKISRKKKQAEPRIEESYRPV